MKSFLTSCKLLKLICVFIFYMFFSTNLSAASTVKYGNIVFAPGVNSNTLINVFNNSSLAYAAGLGSANGQVRYFDEYNTDGSVASTSTKPLYSIAAAGGVGYYGLNTIAAGPFGEENGTMTMFHWHHGPLTETSTSSNFISFIKAGESRVTFLRAYLQDLGLPYNFPDKPNPGISTDYNYWSGGEINQMTGEIYLSAGDGASFKPRGTDNCDSVDINKYMGVGSGICRRMTFMTINPKTGDWKWSGKVYPATEADRILLENKYVASDMAIDAEGNFFIVVTNGNAPGVTTRTVHIVRVTIGGSAKGDGSTNSNPWYYSRILTATVPNDVLYLYGAFILQGEIYFNYSSLQKINLSTASGYSVGTLSELIYDMSSPNLAPVVRGKVYLDDLGDSIITGNEPGVPDIEMELYDEDEKFIYSVNTTSTGDYAFLLPFSWDELKIKTFYVRMKQPQIKGANTGITWASGGRFEWNGTKHPGNNTATIICHNGDVNQKLADGGGACFGARVDGIDSSSGSVTSAANYYAKVDMQTERAVVIANFALAPVDRSDAPQGLEVNSTTYQLGEVSHMMLSNGKVKIGNDISADLTGSLSSNYANKDTIGDDSFEYYDNSSSLWKSVQGKIFENNETYKFKVSFDNLSTPANLVIWTNWDPSNTANPTSTKFTRVIKRESINAGTDNITFDYIFGGNSKTDEIYNVYFRLRLSSSNIESAVNPARGSTDANIMPWVLDGEVEDYWKEVKYHANVPVMAGNFTVVHRNTSLSPGHILTNSDKALYTQVAGKDFNVTLVYYNDENEILPHFSQNINVTTELIDATNLNSTNCEDTIIHGNLTTLLSNWPLIHTNQTVYHQDNVRINDAVKQAAFRLTAKFETSNDVIVSCSESFSIRPANYNMTMQETNGSNIANNNIGGKNYTLKISALKDNGNIATRYTQEKDSMSKMANLTIPAGCDIDDSGAIYSDVTYVNATDLNITFADFNNGTSFSNIVYDNVGNIIVTIIDSNWTIKDQNSSTNDKTNHCIIGSSSNTHDSEGKVGCNVETNVTLSFYPKMFQGDLTLNNFNDGTFTYISSNGAMHAVANADISALLFDNTTATNYKDGCYAQNIDWTLNLERDPQDWQSTKNATDVIGFYTTNQPQANVTSNATENPATIETPSNNFQNGTASNIQVGFNFERIDGTAQNPFIVNANDFNITKIEDANTKEHNFTSIGGTATFIYGRVSSPSPIRGNDQVSTNMMFEGWCAAGCNIGTYNQLSSIKKNGNWYLNTAHNGTLPGAIPLGSVTGLNVLNGLQLKLDINDATSFNIVGGIEQRPTQIKKVDNNPPTDFDISIQTQGWLVFNKNIFRVIFNSAGGWAGEGQVKAGNATGRVIQPNTSSDLKKTMDW